MESNDSSKPSSARSDATRVVGPQTPLVTKEHAKAQVRYWEAVVAEIDKLKKEGKWPED